MPAPFIGHNALSLDAGSLPATVRFAIITIVVLVHIAGIGALLQIPAVRDAVTEAVPVFVYWVAPPATAAESPAPAPAPVPVLVPASIPVPTPAPPKPSKQHRKSPLATAAPKIKAALPPPVLIAPEPSSEPSSEPPLSRSDLVPAAAETAASSVAEGTPSSSQAVASPKTVSISAVRYREAPRPVYPALSRRFNKEGQVIVRVLIDAKGKVQRADLAESSGIQRLDSAALTAVQDALFYPYLENDIAIPVRVLVPINFQLTR